VLHLGVTVRLPTASYNGNRRWNILYFRYDTADDSFCHNTKVDPFLKR
jgi:hypothetical protein